MQIPFDAERHLNTDQPMFMVSNSGGVLYAVHLVVPTKEPGYFIALLDGDQKDFLQRRWLTVGADGRAFLPDQPQTPDDSQRIVVEVPDRFVVLSLERVGGMIWPENSAGLTVYDSHEDAKLELDSRFEQGRGGRGRQKTHIILPVSELLEE